MFKLINKFLTIILLSGLLYFYFTKYNPQSGEKNKPQVQGETTMTTPNFKDIPEMTDILNPNDQEVRIKAGRKLVERVDVDQALEILEHSPLPHTGEGHLVVHQIGFYAYRKYGMDGILKCKDYFLFACYHGVIIEAATDKGVDAISQMTDFCKASSTRFFQCTHAAGHSILAMLDYDLAKGLETCDKLYEGETQFPEGLSSCHNGAFMENLFGVHDWGSGKESVRDWLKDEDPYFPCNYFGEKYQKGCWLNQAARIYQMYQSDIEKTAKTCEGIGNYTYTEWCFDNLARQLHPITNGDINKVFELCPKLGEYWKDGCIIVNAGAFYSVGDRQAGFDICNKLDGQAKNVCMQRLFGQVIGDTVTKEEKLALCNKLTPDLSPICKQQVNFAP